MQKRSVSEKSPQVYRRPDGKPGKLVKLTRQHLIQDGPSLPKPLPPPRKAK